MKSVKESLVTGLLQKAVLRDMRPDRGSFGRGCSPGIIPETDRRRQRRGPQVSLPTQEAVSMQEILRDLPCSSPNMLAASDSHWILPIQNRGKVHAGAAVLLQLVTFGDHWNWFTSQWSRWERGNNNCPLHSLPLTQQFHTHCFIVIKQLRKYVSEFHHALLQVPRLVTL